MLNGSVNIAKLLRTSHIHYYDTCIDIVFRKCLSEPALQFACADSLHDTNTSYCY